MSICHIITADDPCDAREVQARLNAASGTCTPITWHDEIAPCDSYADACDALWRLYGCERDAHAVRYHNAYLPSAETNARCIRHIRAISTTPDDEGRIERLRRELQTSIRADIEAAPIKWAIQVRTDAAIR